MAQRIVERRPHQQEIEKEDGTVTKEIRQKLRAAVIHKGLGRPVVAVARDIGLRGEALQSGAAQHAREQLIGVERMRGRIVAECRQIDRSDGKRAASLIRGCDQRVVTGREDHAAAVQIDVHIGQRGRCLGLIFRAGRLHCQPVGCGERQIALLRLIIHIVEKLRRKHPERIIDALARPEEQHATVSHPLHQCAHLPHAEFRDLIVADDDEIERVKLPPVLRKIALREREGPRLHLPVIHRDAVQVREQFRRVREKADKEFGGSAVLREIQLLYLGNLSGLILKAHPERVRSRTERHNVRALLRFACRELKRIRIGIAFAVCLAKQKLDTALHCSPVPVVYGQSDRHVPAALYAVLITVLHFNGTHWQNFPL